MALEDRHLFTEVARETGEQPSAAIREIERGHGEPLAREVDVPLGNPGAHGEDADLMLVGDRKPAAVRRDGDPAHQQPVERDRGVGAAVPNDDESIAGDRGDEVPSRGGSEHPRTGKAPQLLAVDREGMQAVERAESEQPPPGRIERGSLEIRQRQIGDHFAAVSIEAQAVAIGDVDVQLQAGDPALPADQEGDVLGLTEAPRRPAIRREERERRDRREVGRSWPMVRDTDPSALVGDGEGLLRARRGSNDERSLARQPHLTLAEHDRRSVLLRSNAQQIRVGFEQRLMSQGRRDRRGGLSLIHISE
ncbi:MAG: hypothetical protein QUU85_17935, partial [Candidatus Eisenbacteria bacterium]|nr:hypothetical protein [Candidatus Eisenbacteria bacterium]